MFIMAGNPPSVGYSNMANPGVSRKPGSRSESTEFGVWKNIEAGYSNMGNPGVSRTRGSGSKFTEFGVWKNIEGGCSNMGNPGVSRTRGSGSGFTEFGVWKNIEGGYSNMGNPGVSRTRGSGSGFTEFGVWKNIENGCSNMCNPGVSRTRGSGSEFTEFGVWKNIEGGYSNMCNLGVSRKRGFGSEFTDFGVSKNTDAKRAKVVEVINIDDSDDEKDDWSSGHLYRSAVTGGKPKRQKAESEAYLGEPEVRNDGVAPKSDGSAGMIYCSGQEFDSDSFGQDNSFGAVTEIIDDSAHTFNEESGIVQEESSEVAPEVECRRLDGSVDGEVVEDCNCEPETEVLNGVGVSLIDSFDGSIDCEVVEDCNREPETEVLNGVGVSLIDSFTTDQIREYLRTLKEPDETADGDACQLCAKGELVIAPPPVDCACCVFRIKPGSIFHKTEDGQFSFCNKCFKSHRGQILVQKRPFRKKELTRGKNFGCNEIWVQCHQCKLWQHEICALYNSIHDKERKLTYICPICRLTERQGIPNVPVTPTLGAQDLPRTILSDHLEQRLSLRLAHERKQRAKSEGKAVEEVPGIEDLVIRVVLAADKQIEVKQKFLDILHGDDYPSEFPYKSKVIMLFQKVEGVDVCLFAMYVQEFGSECGKPNQRSVYISYIDSVNYLAPGIKTGTRQALRTFVYHEILIGYLDYCKKYGFNTCYIWACPPVKGDDYIFHCHPVNQKIPRADKLRKWYIMMLNKAVEDNVVAEYTNFYQYFFVPKDNQNKKITAARLPYFDGDFWTGNIENMIETIGKSCKGDSKKNKPKKSLTKRTLKAMGHNDPSDKAAADIQVMEKLGHTIQPFRDDLFVVHLQFTCKSCHEPIVSGNRWSCSKCEKFHLCERCIEGEQTHTTNRGEMHALIKTTLKEADTNDNDISIDNPIFESRHTFLKLCQEKNYQFDTLRRAKRSSVMILYCLLHRQGRSDDK